MKIIDISTPISSSIPVWPNTPKPFITMISSLKDGDAADDTKIEMSIHTGTHIDAPSHFLSDGKTIDEMNLEVFIGPVFVAYLPEAKKITGEDIKNLGIPKGITRLLFKTSNSLLWKENPTEFNKDYVALTEDGAKAIVEKKIKLVGIDYLSIADFDETESVHKILLEKEIAILEGLDLSKAEEGTYKLFSIPIMISGAEAAPTRAVLIKK